MMQQGEIEKVWTIDRSEVIETVYTAGRPGKLKFK
jgi:hypothetical protein